MKRRIIFILISIFFVYFVLKNINSGERLFGLLTKAKWQFILIALLLQTVHYYILGLLHQKTLNLYGVKWRLKEVVELVLAALSINAFTVLAPVPGSTVFIHKARNENAPALSVTASIFLVVLLDYLALIPFLGLSLIFLSLDHNIFTYEIIGVSIFILLTFALVALLLFGVVSPKILKFIFTWTERFINKISLILRKRRFFMNGWSESRTLQFIQLSEKLMAGKNKQPKLLTTALSNHLVDLLTLFLLFLAFGKLIPLSALLTGYSLMLLFWIVTPTPQGVGAVETLTPAVFASMGVPVETATLAVLAYRGLNLWIPVLTGYYFLHSVINKE